jgi:hypothetical protein
VKIATPDNPWGSSPHWEQGFDTETGQPIGLTERTAGLELPVDDDLASTGRIASTGVEAREFSNGLTLWRSSSSRSLDLPDDEVWVTGRFDATSTQLLVEPDRIARSLLLVDGVRDAFARGGRGLGASVLRMTDGPADVELLGWVGRDHALAMLDQDFEDQRVHLVLLALHAEAGEADGTEVGEVTLTGDDVDVSFATDLASVGAPARDFVGDPVSTEEDAGDHSAPGEIGGLDGLSTTVVVGAGAVILALTGALAVAVRRRRAAAQRS